MSWSWRPLSAAIGAEALVGLLNQQMLRLEQELAALQGLVRGVRTLASGAATPSVAKASVVATSNAAPTSITAFSEGKAGQHVSLIFGDVNTTLVHGADLVLAGGVDHTGTTGEVLDFVTEDGATWRQRS